MMKEIRFAMLNIAHGILRDLEGNEADIQNLKDKFDKGTVSETDALNELGVVGYDIYEIEYYPYGEGKGKLIHLKVEVSW